MKTVGKYGNAFSAELAKGLLESEGIESCIVNEYLNYIGLPNMQQLNPVELRVADEDYDRALQVLNAASSAS